MIGLFKFLDLSLAPLSQPNSLSSPLNNTTNAHNSSTAALDLAP